jgi:hypothetical protein
MPFAVFSVVTPSGGANWFQCIALEDGPDMTHLFTTLPVCVLQEDVVVLVAHGFVFRRILKSFLISKSMYWLRIEDGDSGLLRNVCNHPHNYTMSQLIRSSSKSYISCTFYFYVFALLSVLENFNFNAIEFTDCNLTLPEAC